MAETELLQILVSSRAIHSFILLSGATTDWALHEPTVSHLLKKMCSFCNAFDQRCFCTRKWELSSKFIDTLVYRLNSISAQHYRGAIVPFPPDYLMFRSGDLWERELSICYE